MIRDDGTHLSYLGNGISAKEDLIENNNFPFFYLHKSQ
jgi:hypothetical protein